MLCEYCNNEHSGEYGSGRFCSQSCSRKYSSLIKKDQKNKKISETLKGHRTVPGGMIKLCEYGCRNEAKFQLSNGKWCCQEHYTKCPKNIEKNIKGIKRSYENGKREKKCFPEEAYRKGQETYRRKLKDLYETLPFQNKPDAERRRIILKEQENKCLICGIFEWNNQSLTLHLDHKDGNRKNNTRENLRYLCPNCHSQTETYCASGIKKGNIYKVSENDLVEVLKTSSNIHEALKKSGLTMSGENYKRARILIEKFNIQLNK